MECLHLDGEKGQEVSATLLVQTWLRRAEAASSAHPLLLVSNKLLIRQPPPQLNFEPASSSSRPQSSAPAVSDSLMVRGHAASLSLHHSPSEETIESHGVLEEVFAVHRDQSVAGAWDADYQLTTSASDQPLFRRVEVLTEWAPMRKPVPAPLPPLAAEVCDAVFDRVWGVIVPRIAGVVMEALCASQIEHQLSQTPVYCVGNTCQTCGAPKPAHEVKPKHGNKANPTFKPNGPREEKKSEVYFDPVDGSMNVPIAGIKKYYPRQDTEIKVPKVPPPKKNPKMRTIADLEAEAQRPQAIPRGPDGRRDIMGMLQQADNSDTLPCMRKPAKK